ncbi:HD domain-containing phosphohydrolase [Thalassolituus hydrocarboniclasticus]|uniref:HD domain-containing protein n=1 Tax=Thalassolituus hydrocarboniclasticus TaxID=2742796 RepID=A0ABY6ADN0_9GAMM|nr:HD domain-containing phosphohydrolase [Thalassolituus hydrocarboniclasticus]UXD88815.1 HD domain-containing protein [Thalassolituus hydrocarboniclasticus]
MQEPLYLNDPYQTLGQSMHFMQRLERLYRILREQFEGVQRFALVLYNAEDGLLSTFVYESDEASPLLGYSVRLDDVPSLRALADKPALRVVNDMRWFRKQGLSAHSAALLSQGYRSSLTMPVFHDGGLLGFLFLNSQQPGYFSEQKIAYCNLWAHLVGQQLVREQDAVGRMQALVKFATDVSGRRSVETDAHVRRMAAYARMIARALQKQLQLSDAFIEYLALFAPLHDIGKIAIPDSILHKAGPLTADEFERMKSHVKVGRDIVDQALEHFSLGDMEHTDMLRNIVQFHHEKLNGSGYLGAEGDEVPLEARIIAVADILDALLNRRSYKDAWPQEKVFAELQKMAAHSELDQACVDAVLQQPQQVEEIQRRYPS